MKIENNELKKVLVVQGPYQYCLPKLEHHWEGFNPEERGIKDSYVNNVVEGLDNLSQYDGVITVCNLPYNPILCQSTDSNKTDSNKIHEVEELEKFIAILENYKQENFSSENTAKLPKAVHELYSQLAKVNPKTIQESKFEEFCKHLQNTCDVSYGTRNKDDLKRDLDLVSGGAYAKRMSEHIDEVISELKDNNFRPYGFSIIEKAKKLGIPSYMVLNKIEEETKTRQDSHFNMHPNRHPINNYCSNEGNPTVATLEQVRPLINHFGLEAYKTATFEWKESILNLLEDLDLE